MFNPLNVSEMTTQIINCLLDKALQDDKMLRDTLIDCGKSREETREIMEKVRDEK